MWGKCSITKFLNHELLIASHILPWSNATNLERLDKFNGLLLLPNYDKLFDKGIISFTNKGEIIISNSLTKMEQNILGINNNIRLFKIFEENIKYLEKHRNFYKDRLFQK